MTSLSEQQPDPSILPPKALAAILPHSPARVFQARTVIVTEGDQAGALFVILEGRCKAYVSGEDGREAILSIMGPGDYFGEIALLDSVPRTASVRAVEDCRLFKIDRDTFLSAVGHQPGTGFLDRARHRTSQTMHIAAPLRNAPDAAAEDRT